MFSLPPEQLAILVLFLLYHGLGAAVITYLLRENERLRRSVAESTKLLRDIAWVQERVIRSQDSAAGDPLVNVSSSTPLPPRPEPGQPSSTSRIPYDTEL